MRTADTASSITAATDTDTDTVQTTLRAEGFSCPSCVAKIEKRLHALPGVEHATVHFASARVEVTHDPSVVTADALAAAVTDAGYPAVVA